jgi:hypothetical protein
LDQQYFHEEKNFSLEKNLSAIDNDRSVMSFVRITFRYLQCNFEAFDLRELECKFDVILVDPPLEEYQRRGSGISHNWRPWAWEEVYRNSIQGESKKTDTFDIQMNNKGVSFF